MRRYIRLPLIFLVASLLALLLVAVAGQQYRLFERGWFNLKTWWQPFEQSIGLDQYQVVLEAQPIEGLDDDISALTFDPDRNSLFTVTNKRSELIELSLDGRILRRVPLTGFGDPEAVEYVGANSYVITDEREQRLIRVRLTDNTPFLDAKDAEQLTLGIGLNGNKGFEGLAYDSAGKRLFVAKERDPMLIYEVHGFPTTTPSSRMRCMWYRTRSVIRGCLCGICRACSSMSAAATCWRCRMSRNWCWSWMCRASR